MQKILFFLIAVIASMQANSQITRQWVATFNGEGDLNDRYTCITKDASGNIYIGGSTVNPDVNRDFLVVKLNSSGVVQWQKQFSGAGAGPDEVTAIAVDGNGDIYITGFAKGINTGTDYLTVKYNSSGDTLWASAYNNASAMGYDQANSIAVDSLGNVYVTGQSDRDPSSGLNEDYVTVKYNSTGAQQWAQRFNGIGNGTDNAEKLALDASGNVYVTGRSDNGTDDDYVTIKYNPAGTQQWIKYDDRGGRDRASAMTIDGSDNIYITGRSYNGNNSDFWTLKYNSAGALQWQVVYDFLVDDWATAIAVDGSGNVFVTGQSDGTTSLVHTWDYQTVAYNSTGNQIWEKRFDGTASNDDFPNAITADASGNVYVTGQSDADAGAPVINDIVTISYNAANGNQNWSNTFVGSGSHDDVGSAVVASANGSVIAGFSEDSNSSRDAIVLAYSSFGTQLWQQLFNGVGDNNENVRSLVVDSSKNVYAAGYLVQNRNDRDMALVKFSSSGNYTCRQTVNGTATGSTDDAQGVTLDLAGNPIVIGFTKNKGESNDITCYKSDAGCNLLWMKTYPTAAAGSDKVYDVTTDANGDFYITGRVDNDPSFVSNDDCFTAKLDSSGAILWSITFNNVNSLQDRGSFVKVGASGSVYVVGRTFNGTDYGILVMKYDNSGNQRWAQTYQGTTGDDQPTDFKIDNQENLYICGITEESDLLYDYVILKYDSSGNRLWVRNYNGSGNGDDQAQAIAVDATGNIYVTGNSDMDSTAITNYDMVTVNYDSQGNPGWVKSYGSNSAADDMEILSPGQIIIAGHANKGSFLVPNYNVIVFVVDENGNQVFLDEYNGASDSSDVPNLIYVHGNEFYIAGSTIRTGEQRNMLVIKYNSLVGINALSTLDPLSVFPNPFTESFTIHAGENLMNADFKLYDGNGKIVLKKKISGKDIPISIRSPGDGMYFYFINSGNEIIAKGKLIHLK